jgi:hypothetical protein
MGVMTCLKNVKGFEKLMIEIKVSFGRNLMCSQGSFFILVDIIINMFCFVL